MDSENYFGVKKIHLPDNKDFGNLLSQLQVNNESEERILHTLKSFIGKPMVAIYTTNDDWPTSDLTSCMFVGDYLRNVNDVKNLYELELVFNNSKVGFNRLVDLISQEHFNSKILENSIWNLYIFGIADDKTDLYRIIHVNPVLACLSAENNFDHAPLKLYSVQNVYAGMQFNRGKGAEK